MKVCVTGGAGYIGSHAVYELIKENHEVIVIDDLSTGDINSIHNKAKFYKQDISDKELLMKILKEENDKKPIDVIMHFAAKLIVPESVTQPLEYYHTNVEGTRILLETMKELQINNIVFSSTASVYGDAKNGICNEEDSVLPINPYGDSKLACERLIKWSAEAYHFNYCIFRYFNVAGADKSLEIGLNKENLTHLIPVVIETALKSRDKMIIYGDDYNTKDKTCVRDYVHVSDIARAHLLGAKYIVNNNTSTLLNLGSNNGYSVKEIINEVEKYAKVNYEIGPRRQGDPPIIIANNKKAKEVIGWSPIYTIKDIIETDYKYRQKLLNKNQ